MPKVTIVCEAVGDGRAVLIRWDKTASNHLGLLRLACALRWFRRYHSLAGLRKLPRA